MVAHQPDEGALSSLLDFPARIVLTTSTIKINLKQPTIRFSIYGSVVHDWLLSDQLKLQHEFCPYSSNAAEFRAIDT